MTASRAASSRGTGFWERFLRNRLAVAAGALLGLILCLLLAISVLSLGDPAAISLGDRLLPPLSENHWLGTDHLGRDILLRLLDGARVSLAVAVAATALAALVGTLIGLVAGYGPGWLDTSLMRGIDVMMAFPYLLLALAIVAVLGPGLMNALLAVAVVNVPFFARIIRGHTVAEMGRDYVAAARLSGFSDTRILFTEVFPNVLPAVIITMASTVGWMILETAGLSFLGLGAQPPQADLGSMLGEGRKVIFLAPHVGTVPGLAIIVIVVSLNLVADGLRDGLDPRLRTGKLARPSPVTEVLTAPAAPERAADTPLLAVNNLRTWFMTGRKPMKAVDDLSFTLDKGESLGLLGESGSGKSVTALSILKLVPSPPGTIVGGRVLYHGRDLLSLPFADLQRIRGGRIGYVFQDAATALNPLLTAGEQLTETIRRHQGLSAGEARDQALDLMDMVHLPRPKAQFDQYPHALSGGMRQRVMLAAALANDIDLLIADEPTTALDVTTQAAILDLLQELQARHGFALLFITHDLSVLSKVADTAIVMRHGRAVERGPVTDLLAAPQEAYTRELIASIPRLGAPEWLSDPEAEA